MLLAALCVAASVAMAQGCRRATVSITATEPPQVETRPVGASNTPAALATTTPAATPMNTATPSLMQRLRTSPMPSQDLVAFSTEMGMLTVSANEATSPQLEVGTKERFWVNNIAASRYEPITATLRYIGDHVEMWLEDGVPLNDAGLASSARQFDEAIYPTVRKVFGSEWTPGIDGNPRLVVLNADITSAAGYFASANELPATINPYSNEREMFVMNTASSPGTDEYDAILAHEFQHMVHWNLDRNEDAWVNEGASELAEDLAGYGSSGWTIAAFAADPDLQLTTWSDERSHAHYGASYLWLRYCYERFGQAAISNLIAAHENGIAGFDRTFRQASPGTSFEDVFADWTIANLIDAPDSPDGHLGYQDLDVAVTPQLRVGQEPISDTFQVAQYAADYVDFAAPLTGTVHVSLVGDTDVRLTPNEPTSGRLMWWSNRGDSSHSYLERAVDLTGVTSATLRFALWYDIEWGWDYAHVRASSDGGESWTFLSGQHMTDYNPYGNALGPGYTGTSGDRESGNSMPPRWVMEEIDLSGLAGQAIMVRFDLVTDDAINHPGLCIDDIAVPEIGWRDDVETGTAGWQAAGFVRSENRIPQTWIVQAVESAGQPRVRRLALDGTHGDWTFGELGTDVDRVTLVIAALAPYTTEPATYDLRIERLP